MKKKHDLVGFAVQFRPRWDPLTSAFARGQFVDRIPSTRRVMERRD